MHVWCDFMVLNRSNGDSVTTFSLFEYFYGFNKLTHIRYNKLVAKFMLQWEHSTIFGSILQMNLKKILFAIDMIPVIFTKFWDVMIFWESSEWALANHNAAFQSYDKKKVNKKVSTAWPNYSKFCKYFHTDLKHLEWARNLKKTYIKCLV